MAVMKSMSPLKHRLRKYHKKGFTLLELLLVVALIGVLAALIFGMSDSGRRKLQVTQSVANLRSIATATLMLANDHQGKIALYGSPLAPNQTQGSIVEPRGNQMPRALYPPTSALGGHGFGGGSYLPDSKVFHNPRLRAFKAPTNPQTEFGRAPNGRQNVGFFYYSLPSGPDVNSRAPMVINGNMLSNDRPRTCWGRTPVYSDVPDTTLAKDYGYAGDEFIVAHIDGTVSMRSKAAVFAQPSLGRKLYYMATGETQ